MSATLVEVRELPEKLRELISLAASGAEIIVTEDNIPRARLLPLAAGQSRVPGLHAGLMQTSEDFDAPLPEDFWVGTP